MLDMLPPYLASWENPNLALARFRSGSAPTVGTPQPGLSTATTSKRSGLYVSGHSAGASVEGTSRSAPSGHGARR